VCKTKKIVKIKIHRKSAYLQSVYHKGAEWDWECFDGEGDDVAREELLSSSCGASAFLTW